MADLDAENVFHIIVNNHTDFMTAMETYLSSLSDSNTRATIFVTNIPYDTIQDKVFYYLVDIEIMLKLTQLEEEKEKDPDNEWIDLQIAYYEFLLDDVDYHFDTIQQKYPDTYLFLINISAGNPGLGGTA